MTKVKGLMNEFLDLDAGNKYRKAAIESLMTFEEKEGKSIINFNVIDAGDFFTVEMLDRSVKYWEHIRTEINHLYEYMNEKDYLNLYNPFKYLQLSRVKSGIYKQKPIVSREQVLEFCESLVNYQDKFLILAIFEGLGRGNQHQIMDIEDSDVDYDNQIIHLHNPDYDVRVSKELIDFAKKSSEQYAAKLPDRYGHVSSEMFDLSSPKIIKPTISARNINMDTEKMSISNFYKRYAKMTDGTPYSCVKITDIETSGKVHFLLTRAANLLITVDEYIRSEYFHEYEDFYGEQSKSMMNRVKQLCTSKEMKTDDNN